MESLGFPVTAFDHPTTNHNGMRGIRALHAALGSTVQILEADIDSQFQLPAERFRLTVFLGLLYHLKNPFHALERLSKNCDYCVLSTRIARRLPDGSPFSPSYPLAYLLAADELNADDSNYWIFNEAGLRRLLHRANWEVLEYFSTGDTANSDPVSLEHDERAFCLLRSHYGMAHVELLEGWYPPEDTGWRWVAPRFSFRTDSAHVSLRVYLPPEVAAQVGTLRLSISANGVDLEPEILREAGLHTLTRTVPAGAAVTCRSDKSLEAGGRELSLIVASIDFT